MQSFLFFLPSRRLLWRSKSVQGERRTKENAEFLFFLPSRRHFGAAKVCKASEKPTFQPTGHPDGAAPLRQGSSA